MTIFEVVADKWQILALKCFVFFNQLLIDASEKTVTGKKEGEKKAGRKEGKGEDRNNIHF